MAEQGLTHQKMSDSIGISRAFLTQIINGSRFPSWRVQLQIERATNGRCPHGVWMEARATDSDHIPSAEMSDVEP